MSHNLKPVTGQWYRHLDKGQTFRVLSAERDEDLIEIQHFDGDLEELEFAEWFGMDLAQAAEPEDWTGPVDDVETDDLGYNDTAKNEPDWRASVDANELEQERDEGQSTEQSSDTEA